MYIKKYKHDLGFFFLIIFLVLGYFLTRYLHLDVEYLRQALSKFPVLFSGFLFVLSYVIVTFFFFFSKDIFWLAAALLFGAYLSALLISIAEILNACILFYLARILGRGYIQDKLTDRYRFLDEKIGGVSLFWLFIFRAAPLIPYRFLDLAAGLTKLSFRKYFLAVTIGSPVKIFWVQYILAAVGMSVFTDQNVLRDFLLNNKPLLIFSCVYIILVVMAIFKLRPKG